MYKALGPVTGIMHARTQPGHTVSNLNGKPLSCHQHKQVAEGEQVLKDGVGIGPRQRAVALQYE